MWYIILCAILVIVFRILKENKKQKPLYDSNCSSSTNQTINYIDPLEGIPFPGGDYEIDFSIKGINLNHANLSDVGSFYGYVQSLDDNQYDKYAIAVYSSLGKRYGYLPAGNKEIHEYIKKFGGKLRVKGEIEDREDHLFGLVSIRFDSKILSKSDLYHYATRF